MIDDRDVLDDFPTTISRDLLRIVIGDKLGEGVYRKTYVYKPDPTKVIKIEINGQAFHNVKEWHIWNEMNEHEHAVRKYLAPCHDISPNGIYLIQSRTTVPSANYKWPKLMPKFMTDFKRPNFGLLKGKLVCHDYGLNFAISDSVNKRTRKPDWWS